VGDGERCDPAGTGRPLAPARGCLLGLCVAGLLWLAVIVVALVVLFPGHAR